MIMTSKKRVRKSFSVDDLRQEVANESSLQQLLANFIAFPAENAPESNPRTLEAWLVARYGLLATVEVLSFTRSTMSLPVNEQQRLLATFHPHVTGWSLIYRKLKSLIITYSNSNRSTCDYGEQRNSGDRGTVGTEERKAQRNTGHRGTVSAEEQ